MSENEKNGHEHKRKPHEKHIAGRANLNNIDLSQHAKHDLEVARQARHKSIADAIAKASDDEIKVIANFIEIGMPDVESEGEWVPADDPELEPLEPTPIPLPDSPDGVAEIYVPGNISAMNLLAKFQAKYGANFVCTPAPIDQVVPAPLSPLYYLEGINIVTSVQTKLYSTTGTYDPPVPPLPTEMTDMSWQGWAWMYLRGKYVSGVTIYDPDDQTPFDLNDPGHALNLYPEATMDELLPLVDCLDWDEDEEAYVITFSFEYHCFTFEYVPKVIDGVTHMVMVVRPLRWKKKK
jgi:hypothetical protein